MWIQWLPLRAAVRTLIWRLLHLRVEYLYQNLIDRILSNLIPKFSNHVIRIGREEEGETTDGQLLRVRTLSASTERISSCHKRPNFFKLSRGVSCSLCVLSPLILTHQAWMSTPPLAQLSKPEPKLENPSKNFIEAEAYLSFCSTHKKDLHIYNLILQRKLFFPSNVIVNLWYCKPPSLIQSGRSSILFHRYVLLVYFIPIVATRNIKVFT